MRIQRAAVWRRGALPRTRLPWQPSPSRAPAPAGAGSPVLQAKRRRVQADAPSRWAVTDADQPARRTLLELLNCRPSQLARARVELLGSGSADPGPVWAARFALGDVDEVWRALAAAALASAALGAGAVTLRTERAGALLCDAAEVAGLRGVALVRGGAEAVGRALARLVRGREPLLLLPRAEDGELGWEAAEERATMRLTWSGSGGGSGSSSDGEWVLWRASESGVLWERV